MILPVMHKVRQLFPSHPVLNLNQVVRSELRRAGLEQRVNPGMQVGITAGSRGISGIPVILRAVVDEVKSLGAKPVILPAMGSHGGGTPSGRMEILRGLGITAETIGADIWSDGESIPVSQLPGGKPVYVNQKALQLDALILVNRIKPHTSFRGECESGLLKMLAVGLGGPQGAETIHREGSREISRLIGESARQLLSLIPVAMGIAVLEDFRESPAHVVAVLPEEMEAVEKHLLVKARELFPHLPAKQLDLLIVDEMGKCYSGTGMDTNVIGRLRIQGEADFPEPRIGRIVALGLAEGSHGNAYGIGLADFTTSRLANKIDYQSTYVNALTTNFVQRAMLPMVMPTDREAINAAVSSLGMVGGQLRVARIRNTLALEDIYLSANIKDSLRGSAKIVDCDHEVSEHFDVSGDIWPW
ncbi:MAG: nickel pincer cofactor-dependent isomerase, group 22 [Bacillota bacterium]